MVRQHDFVCDEGHDACGVSRGRYRDAAQHFEAVEREGSARVADGGAGEPKLLPAADIEVALDDLGGVSAAGLHQRSGARGGQVNRQLGGKERGEGNNRQTSLFRCKKTEDTIRDRAREITIQRKSKNNYPTSSQTV